MNDLKAILALSIEISMKELLNGSITVSSEPSLSSKTLSLLLNTKILYDINVMNKIRFSNKDPCSKSI